MSPTHWFCLGAGIALFLAVDHAYRHEHARINQLRQKLGAPRSPQTGRAPRPGRGHVGQPALTSTAPYTGELVRGHGHPYSWGNPETDPELFRAIVMETINALPETQARTYPDTQLPGGLEGETA